MKDNFGDTIEVVTDGDNVHVMFTVEAKHADMMLSAKKARKFIRKLQQATSRNEIARRDAN